MAVLTATPTDRAPRPWRGALALAALGVVYGDIGTSPLYALRESLNPAHGVPLTPATVLGLLSLIFWSLMLVVTLKYVVFVLRADHDGEGGILALQALARHAVQGSGGPRRRRGPAASAGCRRPGRRGAPGPAAPGCRPRRRGRRAARTRRTSASRRA